MGFSTGGSGSSNSISTSTDVALNSLVSNNVLSYDASISKWRNKKLTVINVVDLGADGSKAFGEFDSTAALKAAFATAGAHVVIPPGLYTFSDSLVIAPNVTIDGYGATLKLADMTRKDCVRTNSALNNGTVTIRGITIDGNDENQGNEAADGNNYDLSKGFDMIKGYKLIVQDVEVLRTRGHGFNHWNWDYLVVRNYHVMQRKNPLQPSGGRRRDGITGMSSNIDISGVSGYSNDDLIGLVVGASWAGPNTTAINIENVNIRGVSAEVCDDDPEIRAWRGVSLYSMNGFQYNNVTIDNVTGNTKNCHLYVRTYMDSGDTGPNVNKGYIRSMTVSNLSGSSQSFIDTQSFITLSQTTIDNIVISNVARRHTATSYGGSTTIPVTATIILSNSLSVGTMILDNISCVQEDSGTGRNIDLISIVGDARVTRLIANNLAQTQPLATTPGKVTLLRKNVSNTTTTNVAGISYGSVALEGASVAKIGSSSANGIDANTLVDPGNYYTMTPSLNWPDPTGVNPGQMITVYRSPDGYISQVAILHRSDASKIMTRYSDDSGATWTTWLGLNSLSLTKWREGIDASPALVSPSLISAVINQGGNTTSRPTGNNAPLYMQYFDTSLGKPIWLSSKSPETWVDATGATV
jgi:hypothetical protein